MGLGYYYYISSPTIEVDRIKKVREFHFPSTHPCLLAQQRLAIIVCCEHSEATMYTQDIQEFRQIAVSQSPAVWMSHSEAAANVLRQQLLLSPMRRSAEFSDCNYCINIHPDQQYIHPLLGNRLQSAVKYKVVEASLK